MTTELEKKVFEWFLASRTAGKRELLSLIEATDEQVLITLLRCGECLGKKGFGVTSPPVSPDVAPNSPLSAESNSSPKVSHKDFVEDESDSDKEEALGVQTKKKLSKDGQTTIKEVKDTSMRRLSSSSR
jgi:hypothetical protein